MKIGFPELAVSLTICGGIGSPRFTHTSKLERSKFNVGACPKRLRKENKKIINSTLVILINILLKTHFELLKRLKAV